MKLTMILMTTLMAFSASAQNLSNSERLDRLEQQVRDLKSRVRSLEGRDEDGGGRRRRNNSQDTCAISYNGSACYKYAVEIDGKNFGGCIETQQEAINRMSDLRAAGLCN